MAQIALRNLMAGGEVQQVVDSLFRSVTRYSGPENRLTQVLASVLERVPGLALDLARTWTAPEEAAGEVAYASTRSVHEALATTATQLHLVRTQVVTPRGKQLDLVLRFGPTLQPSPADVVLWVENKLGADPHERQVLNYVDELPSDLNAAIVLLAPRASLPYSLEEVPDGVPQRSWQASGRRLQRVLSHTDDQLDRYLLEELITFMREDNLTDPNAIGPELLLSLAYADRAESALARVCEEISRFLAEQYGRPADSILEAPRTRNPDYGWNYYETWTLEEADGEPTLWLDWNALNDTSHSEAEGRSLIFMSGLTANSEAALTPNADDVARHERLKLGIELRGQALRFQRITDDCERFARTAFPEEVLVGRALEDQAASVGRWILDGFHALTLPLPDPPAPTR